VQKVRDGKCQRVYGLIWWEINQALPNPICRKGCQMARNDKGKKRKTYNMTNRLFKKHLADIKRTVEMQEEFERRLRRLADDFESESERQKRKRALLIPKNRTCSVCNKVKLKRRQWVVSNNVVCCKSCYMKGTTRA